ncbi:MAG TPA: TIGR03435 family protein [Bryobacteraceae bacterium]|jgi:uncharacterized protein (TIGR03435 family)|nr:TIGR03435 family protein [Bryobacteraceae bacterium]
MRAFLFSVLYCGAALAQTATAPKFIAADVHITPPSSFMPMVRGPFFGDDRYEIHDATLVDLIHAAYGVDPDRIYGGPSWVDFDRFDVVARVPKGSTPASHKLMLQALLAERFGLTTRNDTKPLPAYKLTVAKPGKLQEANGGETGCNFKVENMGPPPPPPPSGSGEPRPAIRIPILSYTCHGTTMAALAETLAGAPGANGYFDNKPMVDQTGLEGAFDFTLRYTPKLPEGLVALGDAMPLFQSLEGQLGLKAELTTVPMPVIVVESAIEKPTPNSPDVSKSLPPAPSEFDVAEIKPSPPGSQGRGGQPEIRNGRVMVPNMTLQNLVGLAWDLSPNEEITGMPKWFNTDRFDLIAQAPEGVAVGNLTPGNGRSMSINIDALRPMLRSLLIERFQMQVHMEDRPTNTWILTAPKPKLQPADPKGRTKWTNNSAPQGRGGRQGGPPGMSIACTNMSMAEFASALQGIDPFEIRNSVEDATGLKGNWDFTFRFSPSFQFDGGRNGDGPQAGPGGAEASAPSGALSMMDALSKELGLKLELQKRPRPALVIDHVNEKPSEN